MTFKPRTILLNGVFILVCASLLIVLLKAPDETTSPLPADQIHQQFQTGMGKKEAEKHCGQCHGPEGESPLPEGHPPPYRCLFCHKRQH